MSEYKGIQGYGIQSLAQNPLDTFPNSASNKNQVWYSYNNGNFYVQTEQLTNGTYSVTGSLNTERGRASANYGGTQTAAIMFGGRVPNQPVSPVTTTAATEKYDGTNWTTVNSMNTSRQLLGAAGVQTSALAFGGGFDPTGDTAATEKYDGTNWTSVNSMNTARRTTGCGTQTAALATGGEITPGGGGQSAVEKYDGTNWTSVTSLPILTSNLAAAGTQTSALVFGGISPNPAPPPPVASVATTHKYDGTNWTTVNSMNTAKSNLASAGTQTAALAFGSTQSEKYDGTNWSIISSIYDLDTSMSSAGTQTAAVIFGGGATSFRNNAWKFDLNIYTKGITIT